MAARAALGRALVASGGTILALGGATMVVSTVSMGVARAVMNQRKKQYAVPCTICSGHKKVKCDVCTGQKVIRYHPFKELPLATRSPPTACAMCNASGEQVCLNCLGDGTIIPYNSP